MITGSNPKVIEMLYQERIIGRRGLWSRIAAGLALSLSSRKRADFDLLSMNCHLRRDIGLDEGRDDIGRHDAWRP